ncbi:MAG: 16S rRNA (guanine(527)-N(7))-methyltransferase RsmG [Actinomycetota bacterium]|nr:16S rRNA (guanine(527)-N(7))-methyltransferase RsmG [Actinomycetota bacterium]
MRHSVPDGASIPVSAAARAVFADRTDLAVRYAELLATEAVTRGLLGPREVPRIWERHLLNCAVVTELLPPRARIVDVGSGAGLPGLTLAVRRPDLTVVLVESLRRRVDFLTGAVAELGLGRAVTVVHGRAEDSAVLASVGDAQWVTARAVAPLGRLVEWCLPLLRPGGRLLALKGASAVAEVGEHIAAVKRFGGADVQVVRCGAGLLDEPTTVAIVVRSPSRERRK